ncbi:MAG: hypothetical protein IKW77_11885 [Salinivirgaceae bacterium]|nr:hypothetical protein [Salinivirgaceae bacterium]
MKKLFKLGFAASLMAAFVFSGCSKDDDDDEPVNSQNGRRVLSMSCEETLANGETSSWKQEYKYDEQGRLIKLEITRDGESSIEEYKYNKQGDNTETFTNGELTQKSEYSYTGNTVKYTRYSYFEGELMSVTNYTNTYTDSKRKELKSSAVEMNGGKGNTHTSKKEFSKDKNGNTVVESYSDGKMEKKWVTEYDGNNVNLTVYYFSDNDTLTVSTKSVYADSKHEKPLVEESILEGGMVNITTSVSITKTVYTYDDAGNVIERVSYSKGNMVIGMAGIKYLDTEEKLISKQTDFVYNGNTVTYTLYSYVDYMGSDGTILSSDGGTKPTSTDHYTIVYAE